MPFSKASCTNSTYIHLIMEKTKEVPEIRITQTVAILIDGNNIERSLHTLSGSKNAMLNFDSVIPKLLDGRGLRSYTLHGLERGERFVADVLWGAPWRHA